jgi:hypothetical protein
MPATVHEVPKLSAGKLRTAQSFSLAAGNQELLEQAVDYIYTTLGYANRTLGFRLAPKQYKASATIRTVLHRFIFCATPGMRTRSCQVD